MLFEPQAVRERGAWKLRAGTPDLAGRLSYVWGKNPPAARSPAPGPYSWTKLPPYDVLATAVEFSAPALHCATPLGLISVTHAFTI